MISVYKAQASKGSAQYATKDTNWGVLPEESISILTNAEADAWRQRQKARVRAHVRCILQLAKMTTAPDVNALLPLVWQVQVGMLSKYSLLSGFAQCLLQIWFSDAFERCVRSPVMRMVA